MKSDKYCILCISIVKSTKKFTTNDQVIVIMEENMIVIRDPKTFYFEWPKAVDQNLKHEIEFIIKSIESSIQN